MLTKIKKINQKKKEKITKKGKKRNLFLFLLLLLIILLGIFIGASFAKYQRSVIGKAYANIAKPVLEIEREQSLFLTALAPKASYVFKVQNYKENELNEVDMEYYIEIITPTDEAIQFNLYQGEKQ